MRFLREIFICAPFFLFNSISFTPRSLTANFSKILRRDLWKHKNISDTVSILLPINFADQPEWVSCQPICCSWFYLGTEQCYDTILHGILTGKWRCSLAAWVEFAGQKYLLNLEGLLVADLQILDLCNFIWSLGRKTVWSYVLFSNFDIETRKFLAQRKSEVCFIHCRHFQQEENHKGGEKSSKYWLLYP